MNVLYEARALTKERRGSVKKHDGGNFPAKSPMAYFFAVLEDRLGLRPMDKGD